MSQTLYRKYRSQTFDELVGQNSVTQILRNAIRRERLSHAYLFCGPRGTGKTSVARIFAKALCCSDPQDGDCCGKCDNCLAIAAGNSVDVIEIDAASRNKVEDIRDLRDKVGYAPIEFPFKIYIIDEVHMVTPQGFNALLKTLEEPPSHVKFLFATTEPHKLPITILSRCIRFDFQRIPLDELSKHLIWIASEEGFAMEQDAAMLLSRLAEGSARDAISLLDQLTVYCTDRISVESAQELFQLGDPGLAARVVELLKGEDRQQLLQVWDELVEQGADAGRFLVQVSEAIKQDYVAGEDPRMRDCLTVMWEALNLLRFESFPALLVELSLLRCHGILHAQGEAHPATLQQDRHHSGSVSQQEVKPAARTEPSGEEAVKPVQTKRHPQMPEPEPPKEYGDDRRWIVMLGEIEKNSLMTYALVRLGVRPAENDNRLLLEFDDNGPGRTAVRYALQADHRSVLVSAAQAGYGPACSVAVKISGEPEVMTLAEEDEAAGRGENSSATIGQGTKADLDTGKGGKVSADDAMELFGATEIKDGN